MLPPEVRPRVGAAPATDAPLRPSHSYPRSAQHRPLPYIRVPDPLGEALVTPTSCNAGRAGSSHARPGRGARRAPRHRPGTTHAAPCTTPAGGTGQPCACPCAPLRHEGEEPSPAPAPQAAPDQGRGLQPDAALTVVDAPRPPAGGSVRWGYRIRRRAPPPGPNADVHPSPVGAYGVARYAFPRSPPAAIRWG